MALIVESNHCKLTWVLPAWPNVDNLKYGLSGDIRICNTSLVMSSSLKASFKHSDCNVTSGFFSLLRVRLTSFSLLHTPFLIDSELYYNSEVA